MVDELVSAGSRHISMPVDTKNPLKLWRNAARLTELIRTENINLIHARSRAPAWSALLAARQTRIPFVTTYHGAYSQTNWFKGLYNSSMTRSDQIIANSRWTADLITSRNPKVRNRITVIHRGTDFGRFDLKAIDPDRTIKLKQQWALQPDQFVVLHLARLTGWKGQSVVIDSIAHLIHEHPELRSKLRVVLPGDAQGRDDYLAELRLQISKLGLESAILLPGHCDDPAAAMAVADLVVVASTKAEAFGRAAVEAGALRRPVIVTRIGAVGETVLAEPEVTADQRTGWKVEPDDSAGLARSLLEVIQLSKAERNEIGQRARSHCEMQFSLQQMCQATLSVYDKLLG